MPVPLKQLVMFHLCKADTMWCLTIGAYTALAYPPYMPAELPGHPEPEAPDTSAH